MKAEMDEIIKEARARAPTKADVCLASSESPARALIGAASTAALLYAHTTSCSERIREEFLCAVGIECDYWAAVTGKADPPPAAKPSKWLEVTSAHRGRALSALITIDAADFLSIAITKAACAVVRRAQEEGAGHTGRIAARRELIAALDKELDFWWETTGKADS